MSSAIHFCRYCGKEAKLRCSACQEVWYCTKEHQVSDWKKSHKVVCKYIQQNPTSVWIEVDKGEGNGLVNRMTSHSFSNKNDGLAFATSFFQNHPSFPLGSPFAELLGYQVEIYCSMQTNRLSPDGSQIIVGTRRQGLNGAGIYLGCDLKSGLTKYNNLDGPILVTGRRRKDGAPLVHDALWGILNLIWDAMDLYGCDEDPVPTIINWAQQYQQEIWEPQGGSGGAQIYATDPNECRLWRNPPSSSPTSPSSASQQQEVLREETPNFDAMFRSCAKQLVSAMRSDMYPDENTEAVFGIELSSGRTSDRVQDIPLGALIYNVYQEIYKHHLFRGGETVYDRPPGPASNQFQADLANALRYWTLPEKYEEWTRQVVEDPEFALKTYSTEMMRRGFSSDVVNPESPGHCNIRRYFVAIRDGDRDAFLQNEE